MGTLSKKEYSHKARRTVKTALKKMTQDYSHSGTEQSRLQEHGRAGEGFLTQNEARAIIEKMGIPGGVLDKPFQQLSNNELGILSNALTQL